MDIQAKQKLRGVMAPKSTLSGSIVLGSFDINAKVQDAINDLHLSDTYETKESAQEKQETIKKEVDKKIDKNQGIENSGKIIGIDESGEVSPIPLPQIIYNEETQCLEYDINGK